MNEDLKLALLILARLLYKDLDGDVIYLDGQKYYVNRTYKIVKELK